MEDHSKMSVKQLKALLKECKKVHGKSVTKMSKPEMVKLAGVMKEHKKMASMPEKEFEKHVEDMRKMRGLHSKPEKKMVRAKSVPKTHTVKVAFEEEEKPRLAPKMKAEVIQKGEDEEIRYALGKPVKVEKFVVEKELTKDMTPEKKSKKKAKTVSGETTEHEDVAPKKAKRVLTAEHLLKMREGRAKAMTETSDPGAPVAEAPKKKRVLSPEHLAKMKAGREAKKAEKSKPEEKNE